MPDEARNIPSQERWSLRVWRSTGVGRATWLGKSWGLTRIGSTRGLERQMPERGVLAAAGTTPTAGNISTTGGGLPVVRE